MSDKRKEAEAHAADMEERYAKEIRLSTKYTTKHTDALFLSDSRWLSHKEKLTRAEHKEIKVSTVDALFDNATGKTVILDFASFLRPGGSFIAGGGGQEESLCMSSTLYNIMDRLPGWYRENQENKHNGLYANRALYIPEVVFERNGQVKTADVVACAAPNLNAYKKYALTKEDPDTEEQIAIKNAKTLQNRIAFLQRVIEIAGGASNETIILGAWGCGKYGQNEQEVKELFDAYFGKSTANTVIYIPGDS